MAERNLLNEGFIFNTRDSSGAISGTQTVAQQEIAGLVDGDLSTDVYTITPGLFTSLDADLGSRWKINRIELYTDETQPLNFDMLISNDGVDFTEVTMTGSAGLYIGDIPDSTISGTAQVIRYEHRAAALRNIREWRVINDDSLVDFGSDGTQTSVTIDDAPIGNPSTIPEPLDLYNNYGKVADAYVFVDRTFNDAEDQIEISNTIDGTYVGRGDNDSTQPTVTDWELGDLEGTRIVSSGTTFWEFSDGSAKGWEGRNLDLFVVNDGAIQGTTTTLGDSWFEYLSVFDSSFRSNVDVQTEQPRHENKRAFAAKDADTVKVRLRVPPQIEGSIVEGPRLFWRNESIENVDPFFQDINSTLSTTPTSNFNNQIQEFIFEVGSVPTWSGTIRGFAVRPFVVSTGVDSTIQMERLDVVSREAEQAGGSYLTLDFRPVPSGSFTEPWTIQDGTASTTHSHGVDFRHTITQDCIITNLRWIGYTSQTSQTFGIALCRPRSTNVFPQIGSNFDVPYFYRTRYDASLLRHQTIDVWWSAKKGDVLAWTYSNFQGNRGMYSRTDTDSKTGDIYYRTATNTSVTNNSQFEDLLNNFDDWIAGNNNVMLEYTAIPTEIDRSPVLGPTASGGYFSTGTYRTPIFDTGVENNPSCLDFDALVPSGTSIDASGGVDSPTVNVRASNVPPVTGLGLGGIGTVSGTNETIQNDVNFDTAFYGFNTSVSPVDPNQINYRDPVLSVRLHGTVTGRAAAMTQNLGSAIMYHREKDEYWVLNVLVSGNAAYQANDTRPTWDVYDAQTGEYKSTDHVKGDIFYSYSHPEGNNERDVFEGVAMIPDYDRRIIYLIQREDAFFVGSNSYYGIILDMDGTFLNVYHQGSNVAGAPNANRWESSWSWALIPDLTFPPQQTPDVTGANGVFFMVNDDTNFSGGQGQYITAIYRGSDNNPTLELGWINEVAFTNIPGLEFVDNIPDVLTMAYCPADGLLYCTIYNDENSESVNNYDPHIFGIRPVYDESNEIFNYELVVPPTRCQSFGGPSGNRVGGFGVVTEEQSFAYAGVRADIGSNQFWGDDTDYLRRREVKCHTGLVYNEQRDTFMGLLNFRIFWPQDILGDGEYPRFDDKSWTLLSEGGAGTVSGTNLATFPLKANDVEANYGAVSGTLPFSQLPVESLLFPPGRYAQVEYQLNANTGATLAPKIYKSQVCQGLKVGQIPADSSRTIYLRTNIPADQQIGDLTGRLKAFWELEE